MLVTYSIHEKDGEPRVKLEFGDTTSLTREQLDEVIDELEDIKEELHEPEE